MARTKRMRWAGRVALIKGKINAYNVLLGKREGRKPIGRPRRKWENN
jgi:hypothetical protein